MPHAQRSGSAGDGTIAVELRHVAAEIEDTARSRWFHDHFLGRLGFRRFADDPEYLGYSNGSMTVWLIRGAPSRVHRKPPTGDEEVVADHFAFHVPTAADVQKIQDDLVRKELYPIFRSAEHPEFGRGYVSATWVDPDRIVWEVYTTPGRPKRSSTRGRGPPHRRRAKRRSR
jgi:hypothetical protein